MTEVRWKLEDAPRRPGVYLFKDEEGRVLYVGKAADLRARLASYRREGGDGRPWIRWLQQAAVSLETIVTRTEQEALLLEDSLIKTHRPPHNVRLKDDKSFLMVRVDLDERFPRLKLVRAHRPRAARAGRDHAGSAKGRVRLFGPFANARAVRRTLSDLHRVVPLRDCPDHVLRNRSRACIKHQIGLCAAPCVGLVDAAGYDELLQRALAILAGDVRELEEELEGRMRAASEALEFERAAHWRDRLAALRRTVEGQGVRSRDALARDVLALARAGEDALVHRLSYREGRLAESRAHAFQSRLPDAELWHGVLTALYGGQRRAVPEELVLPEEPADRELLERTLGQGLAIVVPRSGERAKMLQLAGENARAALARRARGEESERAAVEALARLADLDAAPETIDGFDVSNFQGSMVVASRVRFRGGQPDKSGYRRFKIRGLDGKGGQDDFAAMREAVLRSLRRGTDEGEQPDLVVIDGGAAQLAKALEAREEAGAWEVAMVGLAKARAERKVGGERKPASEERLVLPGVLEPIPLGRHDPARHLLERVRDEAHRFAITYHRKERGRIASRLDSIRGVGPAKRKALLQRFGSVAGVRQASVEELALVPGIGAELAREIVEALRADERGS